MPPADPRAYTLHPHWAHAVAHLGKRVENRRTPIPAGLVGERIAIHAGADLPRRFVPAERWRIGIWRDGGTVWEHDLQAAAPSFIDTRDERWDPLKSTGGSLMEARATWCDGPCYVNGDEIATRAIVATAVLSGGITGWHPDCGVPLPDWADPQSAWWWCLRSVITLPEPVPVARGAQGPWRLDRATVEAVDAAGGWG